MGNDTSKKIYKRKDDIVHRRIAGETILVPIRGSLADMQKIFSLNPIGEFIWQDLDGSRSLQQISEDIQSSFEVTKEEASADLEAFIAELLREGLIAGSR
jgi:hypothetical protein